MILKIWCEECYGFGEGLNTVSSIPEEAFCSACQGKGYTELESYSYQRDSVDEIGSYLFAVDEKE
jgi:hypothetical protein